ncbi:ATP-binding protein [Mesorhizobium silamurunense]|uniref:ATP-binding protein n=1 Tax=Mesorhizobium silamurunense TaxID=499528 RepID=UPI0017830FB7|nr:ATP-binding protein [Mesorhizobium silamurunense]
MPKANRDHEPASDASEVADRASTSRAAVKNLIETSEKAGGQKKLPAVYDGSFGRTLYDTSGSSDGSVTVVMPPDKILNVTSQALLRIESHPDGRRYVGTVSAGPFYDPDGISADSTAMVISAVNGAIGMPGHHGRLQLQLLGEERGGRIGPANRRPIPNSPVFLVDDAEMSSILGLEGDFAIGRVMGHETVDVPVPVHKKSVLYRHTGVLGTTGGGKSTTITNYAAGIAAEGAAVILLDTEGEYTTMHEVTADADMLALARAQGLPVKGVPNTHVLTLVGREPSNPDHPSHTEFTLEFSVLSPWTAIEILGMNDAQQGRFLAAYDIGRRLLGDINIFPVKKDVESERQALDWDEMESGYPHLTLALLIDVVSACIAHLKKGEVTFWASDLMRKRSDAQAKLKEIIDQTELEKVPSSWMKVSGLLWRMHRLKIFDRADAAHLDVPAMLKPGRVNIIDLSDLDSPVLRNLAIAQVLRQLQTEQERAYELASVKGQTPTPVNLIIEEAHEFLSTARIRQMPTLYEQVARIAKRGRKRWLGLTFVTQLPQNLPDEVLALINNWILHKIQDESVVGRLRRTIPAIDQSMWRSLASLQPGQAVVSLAHMRRPIMTQIRPSTAKLRLES